jgi:acyl-CoA dehydrogenase
MSAQRAILFDTATAVFAAAKDAGFAPISEAGFSSLLLGEDKGGFGGDWGDLFSVLRVAGGLALTLPVGETIIAAKLSSDAGQPIPDGALSLDPIEHRHFGAFVRVGLASGALDAALAMSIEHCNTRIQFGKPLAKQQAVQQSLACFAVEATAVRFAGDGAAAALDHGDALLEIAAAKLRTNQAIGIGTAIAHQVHGAIGFTMDYGLHPLTRHLIQWRSDFGNDAYWAAQLGGFAAAHGGAGLWAEITRRSDR